MYCLNKILSVLLFILFLQACSKDKKVDNALPRLINSNLISDRGIDYVHGVVILRLQTDPLLKSASRENGKIIIKEEAKFAVTDRGLVSFVDKLKRAKAVGVIVANNNPGEEASSYGSCSHEPFC